MAVQTPYSFGPLGAPKQTKTAGLTFGGDPMPDPWWSTTTSGGNLAFDSSQAIKDGWQFDGGGLGLSMGTTGSGQTVTGSVDGASPWVDALSGLAVTVLGSMGAKSDTPETKVYKASLPGMSGGLDLSTLLLIGAVGAGVYFLAGRGGGK